MKRPPREPKNKKLDFFDQQHLYIKLNFWFSTDLYTIVMYTITAHEQFFET